MEDYFTNQTELYEEVQKLLTNFKKDGAGRKTPSYCDRKLSLLNTYWADYQKNHREMCEIGDFEHVYFKKGCYNTMQELYTTIKELLETCKQEGIQGARSSEPEPEGLRGKTSASKGELEPGTPSRQTPAPAPSLQTRPEPTIITKTSLPAGESSRSEESQVNMSMSNSVSKSKEMLKKQSINFRALKRTVGTVNIDRMQHKWEFEDALKTLEKRWSVIDNYHWEIEGENFGDDDEYQSEFTKHEILFSDLKKAINTKMWSVSHREKSTPRVEIPVFSGNYHHWASFKDLFSEAIHKNPSLSDAQKMQFLKGKVTGDAERLIHHLQISSDNYEVCWELLNHRFGNNKLIFTSHLNMLLGLPNMQHQSMSMMKKLHDVTKETLHAVKNLGADITTWDPLLVHLLAQKLDSESFAEYVESVAKPRELPILQEFLDYLEGKFTTLEAARRKQEPTPQKATTHHYQNPHLTQKTHSNNNCNQNFNNKYNNVKQHSRSLHLSRSQTCAMCNADHGLWACHRFLQLTSEEKLKLVNQQRYCINCLISHQNKPCHSNKKCRMCLKGHNSLLHEALTRSPNNRSVPSTQRDDQPAASHVSSKKFSEILLATAVVQVLGVDGTAYTMRALVDGGSQVSLISETAAQRLGLRRNQCKGTIFGIGEKENSCKGTLEIRLKSIYNDFSLHTNVLIMNNLIKNLPNTTFTKPGWSHIKNISLADPEFYISRPVDLLLGADIYSKIMLEGILRGSTDDQPIAQQTKLGWLLCGEMKPSFRCNVVLHNTDDLRRFWETEEITNQENEMSAEDQECLEYFSTTTKRLESGRYEVRLPFKAELKEKLGATKPAALAQFRALERKFERNPELKRDYQQFMDEYQSLNHMVPSQTNHSTGCFLPHHPVIRPNSLTTKLRVVFNASAKSSSIISLNDTMYTGPNLQQDLQTLILKWRQYQYVYTADIEKMYRQIMVHPEDQKYQKIMWRSNSNQPTKAYQLTTITYGTKPGPFLAMMCLKQLAKDEGINYPEAAKCLGESFFVDDFCGGAHTLAQSKRLRNELIALLKSGGFNLRKWSANNKTLLEGLDQDQCNQKTFEFKQSNSTKTLGLGWNPKKDSFMFELQLEPSLSRKTTKRSLLSEISKIFDPQGWLTPITTTMKILFQTVWQLSQIGWDDALPSDITTKWENLRQNLLEINTIGINRWIGLYEQNQQVELHGFCDASNKAYACVIYCRVTNGNTVTITLLMAKARLAPLNQKFSTPRLELLSAQLLGQLMEKVQKCFSNHHNIKTYCWSDSTAVLGWLHGDPGRWKTFVANRVRKITKTIPSECWGYVNTNENSADCASRGTSTTQLKHHELWWQGPKWLKTFESNQNFNQKSFITSLETKPIVSKQSNVVIKQDHSITNDLLNKISSIRTIIRIVAWILRFMDKNRVHVNYLTLLELRRARMLIIKNVQQTTFNNDLEYIRNHNKVQSNSKLLNLNPFLDQDGIMRVGGRLRNAEIDWQMKHPIILPHNHRLTTLLIQEAHELTFHGGARITLANLRRKYWIISGYMATKKFCRQCVTCKKNDPEKRYQLMADLPAARVNPEQAFYHCGVDYTGFVEVKANKGRGIKTTKAYIALFICMVTKAVHIELVSDLSSSAFLAALTRMAARRGAPRHIYSDNGTNFVGANRILQEEFHHLQQVFSNSFMKEITEMGIEFHYNPPKHCQAGGLWERNIRSLKFHLKRVVGHQKLTFEEYTTLLSQLEACLNSRPLCALTEDPDDLNFLTPAHFIIARPGLTIIETQQDARTRWHLITKLFNDLWKQWKAEYLTQLSARAKWLTPTENLKIGDLVTIHDEVLPAGKWAMGRVVETHPGADGLVRVVTLRTKNGLMKRPIVKLAVLPVHQTSTTLEPVLKPCENNHSYPKPNVEQICRSERRHRQKRPTIASIVAALLFFMTLFIPPTNGLHTIQELPRNQSLFFDPVANLQLIRDKWTLVVYYDMSPYWAGIKAYNNINNYLDALCASIETQSSCHMIVSQLRHDDYELEYYNELLLTQHLNVHDRQRRRRRGLIDGVGYLANGLFGVLDSRFAEQYKNDIERVRLNQNHLINLWKNQTSVIESEFDLMKKIEGNFDQQLKFINRRLNSLKESINVVQKQNQNVSAIQDFTLSAMAGNNLLQNLKRLQDTLLDTITDVYHGRISLHLLTPQQLKAELQTIQGQIGSDLNLPITNLESELQYIYQLLKVKARVIEKLIIFEITFPLLSRDTFKIYKIIPIPHQTNDSMISIVPVSNYVVIDIKNDQYFMTTMAELDLCLRHEETYMCQLRKQIFGLKNDHEFCLKNKSENKCQIAKTSCTDYWIELHQKSQYLYFCCDVCTIKIVCQDQVSVCPLTHAGVIGISKKCIIRGNDFTLYTIEHHSNQRNMTADIYIPQVDQINHIVNTIIPFENVPLSRDFNSSFAKLENQIKSIKSNTDTLDNDISYHDIHHYIVIYVLLVVGLCVAATWTWRTGRCRGCSGPAERGRGGPRQEPMEPLPPTHQSSSALSRKQSTAGPRQLSVTELSELSDKKVRSEHLANRWPSFRHGVDNHEAARDNASFTIEDTIV